MAHAQSLFQYSWTSRRDHSDSDSNGHPPLIKMTQAAPPISHATVPPQSHHDNPSPPTNTLTIIYPQFIILSLVHPHAANNIDSVLSSVTWPLKLIQLIGSGANAKVHLAVSPGQTVAVKIPKHKSVDICKEVAMHRSLNHHNIIQFINAGMVDEYMVLVTDFAENGSLHHVIAKDRHSDSPILTWPIKTRIAGEIANALTFLHSQDILHRDIKAANVLLTESLGVKLCDFGLAVHMTDKDSRGNLICREKNIVGTFRWLPPEVLRGSPTYSCASDIYGLGMVLWEMAANCTAPYGSHKDNTAVATFVMAGGRETIPADTPDDYRQLIQRCWSPGPAERPKAVEMAHIKTEGYESLATDGESEIGPSSNDGSSSSKAGLSSDLDYKRHKQMSAEYESSTHLRSIADTGAMTTMGNASATDTMLSESIMSQATFAYSRSIQGYMNSQFRREDESVLNSHSSILSSLTGRLQSYSQTTPTALSGSDVRRSNTARKVRRLLSAMSTFLQRRSRNVQQPETPSVHDRGHR